MNNFMETLLAMPKAYEVQVKPSLAILYSNSNNQNITVVDLTAATLTLTGFILVRIIGNGGLPMLSLLSSII